MPRSKTLKPDGSKGQPGHVFGRNPRDSAATQTGRSPSPTGKRTTEGLPEGDRHGAPTTFQTSFFHPTTFQTTFFQPTTFQKLFRNRTQPILEPLGRVIYGVKWLSVYKHGLKPFFNHFSTTWRGNSRCCLIGRFSDYKGPDGGQQLFNHFPNHFFRDTKTQPFSKPLFWGKQLFKQLFNHFSTTLFFAHGAATTFQPLSHPRPRANFCLQHLGPAQITADGVGKQEFWAVDDGKSLARLRPTSPGSPRSPRQALDSRGCPTGDKPPREGQTSLRRGHSCLIVPQGRQRGELFGGRGVTVTGLKLKPLGKDPSSLPVRVGHGLSHIEGRGGLLAQRRAAVVAPRFLGSWTGWLASGSNGLT